VPALDRLTGLHVVADPAALDTASWDPGAVEAVAPAAAVPTGTAGAGPVTVLRFAPDEAFALGARGIAIDDPDAIVVDEAGFVGAWCALADLVHHVEWSVPPDGPVLAQGAIAGVPAKLWIPGGGDRVLLLAAAPYAHELSERLGWGA
jgi:hypothetical protein